MPGDPQELYEDVYCQRGEAENRIKEQQLDLFADRTSCHRFAGESVPVALEFGGVRAGAGVASDGAGGTELAEAQVGTIRLKLFKVAARVVVTVRRVVFHLSSSYPYQDRFRAVFERVMSASIPVKAGVG